MKQIGFFFILCTSCITMASCSRSSNRETMKEAEKEAVEEIREIVREICACGPTCGCHNTNMSYAGCGKDDSCGCHEHCSCME